MKNLIDGFWTAWTTVSRLPAPWSFTPRTREMGLHLSLVGVVVGFLAGAIAILSRPLDPVLAVFAVFLVQYGAFNLFHLDGLLDSADALLCHASAEKRLAILKDSRIGVFAFFTGFFYLALKAYLLGRLLTPLLPCPHAASSIPAPAAPLSLPLLPSVGAALLIFSYPVTGRAAAALVPCLCPPARKEGLGAALSPYSRVAAAVGISLAVLIPAAAGALFRTRPVLAAGALLGAPPAPAAGNILGTLAGAVASAHAPAAGAAAGVSALWGSAVGAAAACTGVLLGGAGLAFLYRRKVGGFTGDSLGAAVEIGEVTHLLVVFIGSRAGL